MNIQPIVEGHGEVEAVPILLRRLRDAAAADEVDVNAPIRKPSADFRKAPPRTRHEGLAGWEADATALCRGR